MLINLLKDATKTGYLGAALLGVSVFLPIFTAGVLDNLSASIVLISYIEGYGILFFAALSAVLIYYNSYKELWVPIVMASVSIIQLLFLVAVNTLQKDIDARPEWGILFLIASIGLLIRSAIIAPKQEIPNIRVRNGLIGFVALVIHFILPALLLHGTRKFVEGWGIYLATWISLKLGSLGWTFQIVPLLPFVAYAIYMLRGRNFIPYHRISWFLERLKANTPDINPLKEKLKSIMPKKREMAVEQVSEPAEKPKAIISEVPYYRNTSDED